MSTDLMNIAAFKGMAPASDFLVLDPHSESLADGIGSSYGIVGYKGKVWSLRLRGESYIFVRPDDGSPAAFLDVIILRSPGYKSKSYYPAGSYQDGQVGVRPLCAALDGVTPDADVIEPKASACAICPHNVFKVNAEGRKTRECSDYKRLAVLILPSQTKALLGAPLMEPVFLRVPAASLNDLALLGEGMSAQGFHYSSYITRIGFNPEKPHPQMTFRALQGLTNKEAPVVLPLRSDTTALRITGENEVGKERPAAMRVVNPPAATTAPDPVAAAAAKAAAARAATEAATAALAAAKAAAEAEARAAAQASAPIDTGFDLDLTANEVVQTTVATNLTTTASTATTANTTMDTGLPEDADEDLDARIAALMPS